MDQENLKSIYIGETNKLGVISKYTDYTKILIIGDNIGGIPFDNVENIKYSDTIRYVFFYRLLTEINDNTLIILNNILRSDNRHCLEYNCIRRYCIQTNKVVVFNYYPIKSKKEDFMILYDMIQPNPFWKEQYRYITNFKNVIIGNIEFNVNIIDNIKVTTKQYEDYQLLKEQEILNIKKDPYIVPRRLLKHVDKVRGKSDKLDKIKPVMNIVVTDLKVDKYYLDKLEKFKEELDEVRENLSNR